MLRFTDLRTATKAATRMTSQVDHIHMQGAGFGGAAESQIRCPRLLRKATRRQIPTGVNHLALGEVCVGICESDLKMTFLRRRAFAQDSKNIPVLERHFKRSRAMMISESDTLRAALRAVSMKTTQRREILFFVKVAAHHIIKFVWGLEPPGIISSPRLTRATLSYSVAAVWELPTKSMMLLHT